MASINSPGASRYVPLLATLFSVSYTVAYVGILYASPITRPRPDLPRDSPFIIRSRVRAVTVISILCLLTSSIFVLGVRGPPWSRTLALLGLWPVTPVTVADALSALSLTALLFTGPLLDHLILSNNGWAQLQEDAHFAFSTWIGWRNLVAAPITEELVFRACIVPLQLLAGYSPKTVVFISPLYFGIAHVHHAYEFSLSNPGKAAIMVIRTLVQFAYTTVFGWFATFVYLRTGSVWVVIVVHSFCNWMGVPRLTPVPGPAWMSAVYYASLVGGAWGFYRNLWSMTASPNALVNFT